MSLLLSFSLGGLLSSIWGWVTSIGATTLKTVVDYQAIEEDLRTFRTNLTTEIQRVKEFKPDVKWQTRVINVPKAIEQYQKLFGQIYDELHKRIEELLLPFEQAKILKSGAAAYGGTPTASGAASLGADINAAELLLSQIQQSVHSLLDLQATFDEIFHRLETLDDLFLQQGNPRKKKTAEAFVRTGKLHRG